MDDFGPPPELIWIDVEDLFIDPRFQRSIAEARGERLVARIAANFRWSVFGAILVTRLEDGRYSVIDGQHRIAAAKKRGIRQVPAVVVALLNLAEQAESFVRANADRVQVNPYALWKARLAAGEPEWIDFKAALDKAKIDVPFYTMAKRELKPNQTLSLTTLKTIFDTHGDETFQLIVTAVREGFRGCRGELGVSVITAAAMLITSPVVFALREKMAIEVQASLQKMGPEVFNKIMRERRPFESTYIDAAVYAIKAGMQMPVKNRVEPRAPEPISHSEQSKPPVQARPLPPHHECLSTLKEFGHWVVRAKYPRGSNIWQMNGGALITTLELYRRANTELERRGRPKLSIGASK